MQAFRRQGRRFGAGLVCSEMVSACGLSYGNERTLGYLRIARDEHPMAVQVFGSDPELVAKAARCPRPPGADIIDINMGCPVRKVTKTGAGGSLLEQPELAAAIVKAVSDAVDVPVTVKLRRGVANGSRSALELGPAARRRRREGHHAAPALGPADVHGLRRPRLTAELVERVDIPVIASGDITSRERAEQVIAETGAAAVMIGRGAQGNPWLLRELVGESAASRRERRGRGRARALRAGGRARAGAERSVGLLRKFYGWYLHGGRLARRMHAELATATTIDAVEACCSGGAPGADALIEPTTASSRRSGTSRTTRSSSCRSRSTAAG